jgi:2-polyprenyl-3-methyl-5-hydroxy-6-metoxy-1,4-benzoquinol methylase
MRDRRLQPELMDQPELDSSQHVEALRGLERLNRWSRSARIIWSEIHRILPSRRKKFRILDIASGAGDVPIELWKRAWGLRHPVEIHGWDKSSVAVEHARHRAAQSEAKVEFHVGDALTQPLPGNFDVIISSLFLHHLQESQAIDLLRRMRLAAKQMTLVNDLERCYIGYLVALLASRVLTRSEVVHTDALRSVAGAYTRQEVRVLAHTAGMTRARVVSRWPFRFLLSWVRA